MERLRKIKNYFKWIKPGWRKEMRENYDRVLKEKMLNSMKNSDELLGEIQKASVDLGNDDVLKLAERLRKKLNRFQQDVELMAPIFEVEKLLEQSKVAAGPTKIDVTLESEMFKNLVGIDMLTLFESDAMSEILRETVLPKVEDGNAEDGKKFLREMKSDLDDVVSLFKKRQDLLLGVTEAEHIYSWVPGRWHGVYKNIEEILDEKLWQMRHREPGKVREVRKAMEDEKAKKPRLFGKGDYYEKLGEEILKLKDTIKSETGGICSLADLYMKMRERRLDIEFNVNDVEKAVKKLDKSGMIADMYVLPSGLKLIEFVPVGMTEDSRKVLEIASSSNGYISLEDLMMKTQWDNERVMRALQTLEQEGVTRRDSSYAGGTAWYVPSLYKG
jgi:hypothetical protein